MKKVCIIFILLFYCSVISNGQQKTSKSENELIALYDKVYKAGLKFNQINDETSQSIIVPYEKLKSSNIALIDSFKRILRKDKTMNTQFSKLKGKTNISVVTSEDGLIRAFSWDTFMGGEVNMYAVIIQYRDTNGEVHAISINGENQNNFGHVHNVLIDSIYSIHADNSRYYLLFGYGTCGALCASNMIFTINVIGSTLNYPNFIKKGNIATNKININYNIDSRQKRIPKFKIDKMKMIISEPIINDGLFNGKYTIYHLR